MRRFLIFVLFLQFSCAAKPVKTTAPAADDAELLWTAARRVALNYPIRDLSKEDQFIESDWIYEGKFSRYRFFITLSQTAPFEAVVEIQSQRRPKWKSAWQWSAPSLDKEERLKQAIDAELQKSL